MLEGFPGAPLQYKKPSLYNDVGNVSRWQFHNLKKEPRTKKTIYLEHVLEPHKSNKRGSPQILIYALNKNVFVKGFKSYKPNV